MFGMKAGGFGSERSLGGSEIWGRKEEAEESNLSFSSHIIPMSVFLLNARAYTAEALAPSAAGTRLMHFTRS